MAFKEIYRQYRVSFLGLAVMALLVFVGIVPTLISITMAQGRLLLLQTKVEYQKAFIPLSATLTAELKKLKEAQSDWEKHRLPAPEDMNEALAAMLRLAGMAKLQAPRFTPVSDSVLGKTNQLKIETQLSAPTEEFRHFFYLVTLQPWVIRVEAIDTQAMGSGAHTASVSLWVQLNVDKKAGGAKS